MPREVATASPVGRCSAHRASPPSTAMGEEETLHPPAQPLLEMFSRMCQTASYVPGSPFFRRRSVRPKSAPVSWNRRSSAASWSFSDTRSSMALAHISCLLLQPVDLVLVDPHLPALRHEQRRARRLDHRH